MTSDESDREVGDAAAKKASHRGDYGRERRRDNREGRHDREERGDRADRADRGKERDRHSHRSRRDDRDRRRSQSPEQAERTERRRHRSERVDRGDEGGQSEEESRRGRRHRDRDRDRDGEYDRRRKYSPKEDRRDRRRDYGDSEQEYEQSRGRRRDRERWRDRDQDRERDRHDSERVRAKARNDGRRPDQALAEPVKQRGPLPDQADSFALQQYKDGDTDAPPPPPKEKPNFGNTGVLAAASHAVTQADGSVVTLKYHEPPEARKPPARDQWRLFVFKDGAIVDTVPLSARSCWLVGREASVVDLLAAHPSVSKQHAAVQFRHVERRNEFGDRVGGVKPYLLDLASANGTLLNGEAVAAQRYIELQEKDMVQFGQSTREYVLMKE